MKGATSLFSGCGLSQERQKNNKARTVYLDNALKEACLNQKSRQKELAKILNKSAMPL